jgi:hypothetical protein
VKSFRASPDVGPRSPSGLNLGGLRLGYEQRGRSDAHRLVTTSDSD